MRLTAATSSAVNADAVGVDLAAELLAAEARLVQRAAGGAVEVLAHHAEHAPRREALQRQHRLGPRLLADAPDDVQVLHQAALVDQEVRGADHTDRPRDVGAAGRGGVRGGPAEPAGIAEASDEGTGHTRGTVITRCGGTARAGPPRQASGRPRARRPGGRRRRRDPQDQQCDVVVAAAEREHGLERVVDPVGDHLGGRVRIDGSLDERPRTGIRRGRGAARRRSRRRCRRRRRHRVRATWCGRRTRRRPPCRAACPAHRARPSVAPRPRTWTGSGWPPLSTVSSGRSPDVSSVA